MVALSLFKRLSRAILLNKTVFNSDDLILKLLYKLLILKRKDPSLKALQVDIKLTSSYFQVTLITVKSQFA